MYSLEFALGAIGNSVVVLGYIFCLKEWKSGNIYLFNLSLSDLLFLCTLPVLVSSYSRGQWIGSSILCHSNRDHALQKRKTAFIVCIAVWVLVILELLPLTFFLETVSPANNFTCLDYASSGDPEKSLIYSLLLTLFGFLIPLAVMCFFYVKMLLFLKTWKDQSSSVLALERPLTLVVLAVTTFSLLFTPYHVMRNVRLASRIPALNMSVCTQSAINTAYIVTRPIAFLNSAINPVFYFLMGDHFREMLMAKVVQVLGRLKSTGK